MDEKAVDHVQEALRIVDAAREKNITLRIMGAVAIIIKCKNFLSLHNSLGRRLTDIDLVGFNRQSNGICTIMKNLGYEVAKDMLIHENRFFFYNPKNRLKVDIFLDRLKMNHTIDFRKRLDKDYPTISLADLLLEKLQIVQINEKDIKDVLVLLRAHPVKETEDGINADYISRLLADDWGFHHTVMANLNKIMLFSKKSGVLDEGDKATIDLAISKLVAAIDHMPKTARWKLRARMGTAISWYNSVEEVERQ